MARPTDAELRILQVLWARGPSTVREVHKAFPPERPMSYATALKFLQIMHTKGLVRRDESSKSHIYRAAIGEQTTQRGFTKALLDSVFKGSATRLVQHALSVKPATVEDLATIRAMLDAIEKRTRS
jgi:predicted transcriptional regulator